MLETINAIVAWSATVFRAGGMLAKKPMTVKLLVSVGNLGWLCSGILTNNLPLIASNGVCLVMMIFEIIKGKKMRELKEKEQ